MAVAGHAPSAAGRTAALGVIVSALALFVFAPIVGHEWLSYDDDLYITGNPAIELGLSRSGIAWAFTTFYGANWFPLTWLSWLADYEIAGLEAAWFHATNLALHSLASLLLFLALVRLTGDRGRSAFVGAVFAVHPLHVEAVAWAAARKDSLSGVFFALALLVYAHRVRNPSRPGRLALLGCLALGLMAKPTLVTLPFVLLLLDEWPLARLRRNDHPERWDAGRIGAAVREKLPLFAVSALFCGVVVLAQRGSGMLVSLERLSLTDRAENALLAYVSYLRTAFWPTGLAPIYPHPAGSLAWWQPAGAALLLAALTTLALVGARRRPAPAIGWLWFVGMLVPMIGLVQVGSQARADRYMYLPLVGLAVAVAWGVPALVPGRLRGVLGVTSIAALAAISSVQLRYWHDTESLFAHTLEVTGENAIAHAQLGAALLDRDRPAAAIHHYREALRIRPTYLEVANNLGWLLATAEDESLRSPAEAVELAERADTLTGHSDAGVLDTLAAAYAAAGRFEEARRTLAAGIELAQRGGQEELAALLRTRAPLYRAGRAYREPVTTPATHRRAQ